MHPSAKKLAELSALEDRHRVARVLHDLQSQTSTLNERSPAHMALIKRISADLQMTWRASLISPYVLKLSDRRCKLHRIPRRSSAPPRGICRQLAGSGLGSGPFRRTLLPRDFHRTPCAADASGRLPRLWRDLHRNGGSSVSVFLLFTVFRCDAFFDKEG